MSVSSRDGYPADLEDGGAVNGGDDDVFSDEDQGLVRRRRRGGSRGSYETVATNNGYTPRRSCCAFLCGFTSVLCQTVVVVTAMLLIGTMGYLIGSAQPDLLIATLNSTAGIDLTGIAGLDTIAVDVAEDFEPEDLEPVPVVESETLVAGCEEKDLNETASTSIGDEEVAEDLTKKKTSVKVRYDPSAVLANSGLGDSGYPFDTQPKGSPLFAAPPYPFYTASMATGDVPAPAGFLKSPHLIDDRLVFLSEGDAYVASLDQNAVVMPASKVTTTIGNVLDPKWHPTLPLLAYTATYTGRRELYLQDLSPFNVNKSPMRLTYWDVGGGVNGVVGWIKSDDTAEHANAVVIRALSNADSLPDYRLYVIHLGSTLSGDSSSYSVSEIEPVPLAQAREAARFQMCWYFVRVKQNSHTIRYVGGQAENLWKYCDSADAESSQLLLGDDSYRGTSKSPQLYHNGEDHYLFFLSDRGMEGNKKGNWAPDRMNIWALKLNPKDSNDRKAVSYSTKNLIRITDTACDFEGRTIQEYSIDETTGNLVVRIGADLYFMSQDDVQAKIKKGSRARLLEEQGEEEKQQQEAIESEMNETEKEEDEGEETIAVGVIVAEEDAADEELFDVVTDENDDFVDFDDTEEEFSNATSSPMSTASDNVTAAATNDTDATTLPSEAAEEEESKNIETIAKETLAPTVAPSKATEMEEETTTKETPVDEEIVGKNIFNATNSTDGGNSTEPPAKYFYDFQSPELISRADEEGIDHFAGRSSDLKRLPIVVNSDFQDDQERIVPVNILKHFTSGDIYEAITGSMQMLMTLRGQLWVAPVTDDDVTLYKDAGQNLPARRYRVAPGAMMGGATRILAAMHVPNPVEDDKSDRRLAVILATDPLTPTAEHAFYLIETQAGASPLFVDFEQLPKPFLGGTVSGGSTRDGGLGSVKTDTLVMSACGNRMAWSDTDGRIVVMNLPQYQNVDDEPVQYIVLPKTNELDEPMIGDEVELSFSPGGRYLAIEHLAKNRFSIISIADLGDPLGEENKIADISLGRIVQATPSKFNSLSAYWGKTPTDIHDLASNKTMSKILDLDEADDVSTTLYFLSDGDILTDVTHPWGYRITMPHFVKSYAVFALPLRAKDAEEPPKGQFRGSGAEELLVDTLLERKALVEAKIADTVSATARRGKRKLAESLHPLAGAFGFAKKAFDEQKRRQLDDDKNDSDEKKEEEDDDRLKEAVFEKDMDIDFGAVDLTFARRAYRISGIPAGDYVAIVCQCPDGSLSLVHDGDLVIFEAEGYPSDKYEKKTFVATSRKLHSYSLSTNRKFVILVYSPDGAIRVVPNTAAGMMSLQSDLVLDDNVVDKDGLHLSIWPKLEYRQLYDDAWRMLRDYFYDPDMTGIDWPAVHERYLPMVERCSKREEIDDVLGQMASELSALHVFVYGGEYNSPTHGDKELQYANEVGSLGAILKRTPAWKGYTVMSIPEANPDFTKIDQKTTIYSPLCDQSLRLSGQRGLEVGDVIVGVNGESVMSVPDIHMLLRGTAGRSVRLEVLRLASGDANEEGEAAVDSLITVPVSPTANSDLLYNAWEWKTEQLTEQLASEAEISVGYVHLRSMSGSEAEDAFARGFFPNYHKQGFILDVRHNLGGNIDSWVLDVLQRKPWQYWQSRDFDPENGGIGWDEQYAFRGHLVVLMDEKTSSDGEGVSRGISELGLGKLIGTRTWGGGIWLSSDNKLVDGGIATAPEIGDYNDKFGFGMGIENVGIEPDIVVDNDPRETYSGRDKQLERAIDELKKWIEQEPVVVPKPKAKPKDVTMGDRECKA